MFPDKKKKIYLCRFLNMVLRNYLRSKNDFYIKLSVVDIQFQ